MRGKGAATLLLGVLGLALVGAAEAAPRRVPPAAKGLLATEKLVGKGVWVEPFLVERLEKAARVRAVIWLEQQLLGDGGGYLRRAKEFRKATRRQLRHEAIDTLKSLSKRSYGKLEKKLTALLESGAVRNIERHWIINGFSCGVTKEGLAAVEKLPGVRKIFAVRVGGGSAKPKGEPPNYGETTHPPFDPGRYKHPWYVRQLLADKVWKEFGVTGKGTLNIVHDFNFVFSPNVTRSLHRNPGEVAANGKDDDGNGLIDDVYGYNFAHRTGSLTANPVAPDATNGRLMHGFMCAAIICGAGAEGHPYEFGIAPEGRWAGVVSGARLEATIEWAVEQGADTYSMSFSSPDQGEYRSHRRKVMEHGSLCGVFFVSGAGNFAQSTKVPVQMRQPEDIPNVVFSAAGVQRDLSRTPFSSKGPVEWNTEHYSEGTFDKPEVCAFNQNLPFLRLDGEVRPGGLGGNSFAGPMFCGTIALMLSADPDLLPWDLMEIITSTATDVAAKGYDHETGHGLINCYRAVKEVLRRKAKREKKSAQRYQGREAGDELDKAALAEQLVIESVLVQNVAPKGQAKELGVAVGDVLVSYGGTPITRRADLQAAKKAAEDAGLEEVPVVLKRGETTLELTFKPGRLGIGAGERYKEPVFR